jgi:hypothetical protein
MRIRDASADFSSGDPTSRFPLPDIDVVAAAWSDRPPAGEFPPRPDRANAFSGVMLALGVALLLVVPLGGALFLVAGGLGLVISSEVQPSSSPDR